MSACATCGKTVENEAFSGVLCQSCFEGEHAASDAARGGFLSRVPIAILVGLVPFFISFRSSSSTTSTVNGVVEATSHSIDYVAAALGPVAVVLGGMALTKARAAVEGEKRRAMGFAIAGMALGLVQLARAFG